jgi:hypothetical protein
MLTLLCSAGGPPLKQPSGRFKGGPPQGKQPAAVFNPLESPTPYASAPQDSVESRKNVDELTIFIFCSSVCYVTNKYSIISFASLSAYQDN